MMKAKLSKFNCAVEFGDKFLVYNSLRDVACVLKSPLTEVDTATLIEHGLAVDETTDEDGLAYKKMVGMLCNESKISLTILPTLACNFRCTYCYENHESAKMSFEVEKALIAYLRKNSAGKDVFISWFGGEPLLCLDTIRQINSEAKKIASYYHKSFSSAMTTNGYLLDLSTFNELLKLNIRSFQITIDGNETSHNRTRPLIGNKPTYRTIVDNLKEIRDNVKSRNFQILIRVNLLAETLSNLDAEVLELQKEFGSDSRYLFFFKQVGDYGGERVHKLDCSILDEIDAIDKALLQSANRYNIIPTSNVLNSFPCCYAAESHSLVVLPNGELSKCTVHFDSSANRIGRINSDGSLNLNGTASQWELIGRHSFNAKSCQKCQLLANCFGGGCPAKRIVRKELSVAETSDTCPLKLQTECAIKVLYHMRPEVFHQI